MKKEYEIIKDRQIKYLNIFLVHINYRNMHIHNELEICLVLKGRVNVMQPKLPVFTYQTGDLFIFNPMQPHELKAVDPSSIVLSIQISYQFCASYYPGIRNFVFDTSPLNLCLDSEDLISLKNRMTSLALCYFHKEKNFQFVCISQLNQFMYQLLNLIPYHILTEAELSVIHKKSNRLNRITQYIEEEYSNKLLLSHLAKKEGLSLTYLSHFFKDNFNLTFQEYINEIRFEKARILIEQTDLRLIDICLDSGFSSTRYLNQKFMKKYNCSALVYREKYLAHTNKKQETTSSYTSNQQFLTDPQSIEVLNGVSFSVF